MMAGQSAPQDLTIKGTTSSDITTWIDPSTHRVVKTHMTAKSYTTMGMTMAPGSATLPGPTGQFTIKCTVTMYLG